MINGDGSREKSPEVTPPDGIDEFLPWQGQQFIGGGDLSPVSSQYSSCGESEFERYCSANSVMGTPSLCSSIGPFQECLESDFGSMRSLEGFSLGGSFDKKLDDRKILSEESPGLSQSDGKSYSEVKNTVGLAQGLVGIDSRPNFYGDLGSSTCPKDYHLQSRSGIAGIPDLGTALGEGLYGDDYKGHPILWKDSATSEVVQSSSNGCISHEENAEAIKEDMSNSGSDAIDGGFPGSMRIDEVGNCLEEFSPECGLECETLESGRYSDRSEALSRYEHSEGEDSMFGYGIDDENHITSYHDKNIQYHQNEDRKNENSLLMTSSTAFGSDDWDDYMQETGANPLASIITDDFWDQKQQSKVSDRESLSSSFACNNGFQCIRFPEQQEGTIDFLFSSDQVRGVVELAVDNGNCSTNNYLPIGEVRKEENVKDMGAETNKFRDLKEPGELPKIHFLNQSLLIEDLPLKEDLNFKDDELEREHMCKSNDDATSIVKDHVSKSTKLEKTEFLLDSPTVSHLYSAPGEAEVEDRLRESLEDNLSHSLQLLADKHVKRTMNEEENDKINAFYNEIVHDMEEILLDSRDSPGARFIQGSRSYQSQIPLPLRDGGSTASTSSSDNVYLPMNRTPRIDRVEVVGARQKKGDVSLSERLVGVKEYTLYKLRVWSGEDNWEVERRYRDFCTLHRRLKTLFANQGWILPSPWSSVERESRKLFGNASPAVIAERSILIRDCLQSLLDSRFSYIHLNALVWFLSPPNADPVLPKANTDILQSPFSSGDYAENNPTFGKTISLIIKIWPKKSTRQILEAQYYTCAGCHKHFDDGKTRIRDLVQTLGWGKPRLCEYSGQFFCASCHTNETAVLPARVLHLWDFTQYPVSQLAKYYLDSIHDQPMLCVSAANPLLFSKVPALQHVTNIRRKIGTMLPYVHCPFRRTIFKGLGSRRYLLESSDFFALRDLIDLSRGVFAALPVMVETVSKKILEHITEQCLVCCDLGVACNARQACHDPSSLIFPFQEGEVERCRSCELVFHKSCFKNIATCPCGVHLKPDKMKDHGTKGGIAVDSDAYGTSNLLVRQEDSGSSVGGFLSGLFSTARPEKLLGQGENTTVISMGSLPSTSM